MSLLTAMCHFLVSGLFLLLLLGINQISTLRFPPKILESDDVVNISPGSTLKLTCEGDEPVTWKTINKSNGRFEEEVSEEESSVLRRYKAVLTLSKITREDSGVFTCYHRDSLDPDDAQDMTEVTVSVRDEPDHLLVPSPQYLPVQMKSSSENTIPCRSTQPTVNVTLWKADVKPNQQFINTYDPTKGFIINYPSPVYSGNFYCLATLGSRSEKLHFILLYLSDTTVVPMPNIYAKGKYAIEHTDFELSCSVRGTPDVFLSLEWKYPNSEANRRVTVSENISRDITLADGRKYRETTCNLTIEDIRKSDEGNFVCVVTDHNSKKSEKSIFVQVRDEGNAFISFSLGEGGEDEAIEQPLGSPHARFVVFVKYFPTEPVLTWYKSERLLANNNKYHVVNTNTASTLTVVDLGRKDSGVYTLVGRMGDIQRNFSLTLLVTEPPEVSIRDAKVIYHSEKHFNLTCHSEGCPSANITWEWSPCLEIDSCPKQFHIMGEAGDNHEQAWEIQDGCHVQSILNGSAFVAGYYRCSAESHLGISSTETPFFITDQPSALGVDASTTRPFERDELRLSCYASFFYYSMIQWMWLSEHRRDGLGVLVTNTSQTLVTFGSTRYSRTAEIRFHQVETQHSGQYLCQAKQKSNNQWRPMSVNISVIKTVSPKVIRTNLNNSEFVLYKEDNFEFECLVSGLPSPNISWFRNGTRILEFEDNGATQILDQRSKLVISRVLPSDSGHYICQADNRAGTIVLNATLVVRDVGRHTGLSRGGLITIIVVALVCSIIIAVLGVLFGRRICREMKEKKEFQLLQQMLFNRGDLGSYNPDLPLEEQVEALPYDNRWEFPRERLRMGRTIGQGAFGRVVKAEATKITPNEDSTPVAVKMLKERADLEQRKALMQELKIMIHLGRHINVVNLLGAVTKELHKGEFLVIVEYCRFGNLRHFLLRNRENFLDQVDCVTGVLTRTSTNVFAKNGFFKDSARFSESFLSASPSSDSGAGTSDGITASTPTLDSVGSVENYRISGKPTTGWTVTTTDIICYAFQISSGMEYLSSKKLVHRDLALRNILLAEGNVVKICDFGLAKDCYKKSYYRKKGHGPLPVKWMAIESIRDRVFCTESDVWSFGIVLWELFTLGGNPYPGLEVDEEFYRKLNNGYRMEKPQFSTEALYGMMLDCWRHEPKCRPTFSSLKNRLTDMLDSNVIQHYLNMNDKIGATVENPHYMNMLPVSDEEFPSEKSQPDYQNVISTDLQNETVHYLNMASPTEKRDFSYGDHKVNKSDELLPMLSSTKEGNEEMEHYKEPPSGVHPVNNLSSPNNPFAESYLDDDTKGYLDMGNNRVGDANVTIRSSGDQHYLIPISPPPRYTQVMNSENAF